MIICFGSLASLMVKKGVIIVSLLEESRRFGIKMPCAKQMVTISLSRLPSSTFLRLSLTIFSTKLGKKKPQATGEFPQR